MCALAAWSAPTHVPRAESGPWYSIIPPLLAVTLALLTNRLFFSLGLAVVVGGVLTSVPAAPLSILAWGRGLITGASYVWSSATDSTNLQILAFVILVMGMISVIIVGGGLHAIASWLTRFAKGSRSTQFVTALMGLAVFIDDYANTMLVGSAMRPITDRNRVSREKLAFLVDATSAPVAGIAVISTWIGYEVGLFNQIAPDLDIARDGYSMFFDALPFRFYCILMLIFVFINVLSGADYGSMGAAEERVGKTGALAAADARPMTSSTFTTLTLDSRAKARGLTAIFPIAALFLFFLGGLWVDGGGREELRASTGSIFNLATWRVVMSRAEHSTLLLAVAAGVGLLLSTVCGRVLSALDLRTVGGAVISGFKGSLLPILILVLAWSLKEACKGLGTGPFLVALLGEVLSPIWFPALLFLVASLTSFATGTSWGTMAILIPIAIPVAFHLDGDVYGLTTMICLGAVLDGAILGDHCSPISDTTIMSSISSSCDHVHHVRTQIPYSVTVGVLAMFCGYIPAALGVASWIGISFASAATVLLFYIILRMKRRRDRTRDTAFLRV
ncbi:hypothetical protein AMJ85_05565 [candidate division BRC1 bacterium SM23_51]|nr:MAG: hypothetical protein AMJ85_05565 [candidate division BRC1 bacterium SM23_51]